MVCALACTGALQQAGELDAGAVGGGQTGRSGGLRGRMWNRVEVGAPPRVEDPITERIGQWRRLP